MPDVFTNGINIHYEVRGEGEPILFLHGLGGSWKMWAPQMEYFPKKHKMIMMDLRGHGGTSRVFPNDVFDPYLMAEDVKYFLDELGIKKINIVGLSQGSVTAQLFAIKYSHYIKHLILSNGYSEIPTLVSGWVLKLSIFIFKRLSYKTLLNLMMKVYKNDEYTKKILDDSFSIDKKTLIMAKAHHFPNHTSELKHISAPTLVMGGDRKVVGVDERKGSEILFENIPNSTLALFKDAFDPLSTMRKDIFNEMIMDFIEERPLKRYDGVRYKEKDQIEVS
ncbi:alpha/beta fold hydrolase [Terrilactibacillus laevilacticus]|uniref:Alpha/beta fold hydrolase n=2 Tax=Terrilactibacillus laevilacticus TaxID=1380157 RepID=A0ABW5PNM3_9BACI|nr:alpha/beta hydrolase [Terrilactibacillus laevilacticus]